MATNFPTSLDNLSNPAGSDPINNPSHATQHANVNDAIEVLEAKVGVNNSAVTTSLDYRVKQLETNPTYTNEMAQDAVAAALAAGTHTNITINYNDTGNSISISAAAGYTNEEAVDAVAAALTAGSGISISYNDSANTITISVDSTIATKTYVDTAVSNLGSTAASTYVLDSSVGNPDGVASLDATGKVPDTQIPAGIARDSEVTSAISTAVNNLINSAPGTLDTLGEIAAALAADESAAAALTTLVNTKAPLASPTFTGTVSGITKSMVGLESVDNTADTAKPISTATQTALDGKVSKAGGDTITPSTTSTVGLIIKGAASQTANLQEWKISDGTAIAYLTTVSSNNNSAHLFIGGGADWKIGSNELYFGRSGGNSYISHPTSFTIQSLYGGSVIVKGNASQTANLQEWQNSAGTTLAYIASNGYFNTLASAAITGALGVYGGITTVAGGPAASALITKGVASQTGDLQQWQNSAGTSLTKVNAYGRMTINSTSDAGGAALYVFQPNGGYGVRVAGAGTSGAALWVDTVAGGVGTIIRGAASQTANLIEIQDSTGGQKFIIGSTNVAGDKNSYYGFGLTSASIYGGFGRNNNTGLVTYYQQDYAGAGLLINSGNAGTIPFAVKGAASQTANLQEWQNSTGTVLAKVDSTGAMFTITPADSTNTTQVATTAYVKSNIANLVSSAPATLDTLNELATALGNDANFSTTITNSLAAKAPLASPTFTGAPLAPTASSGTNTTQIATTAFVKTAIDTSVQPGAVYQTSAPSSPAVGQIWIDSDEDVTTFDPNIIRRKAITATAGQTVFTADLPFIDGFEQIFMNGLLLVKTTDYTTSGGNTVTLTSAAAASDVIEIVSVTGANSANTYTQAEINALLAANTSVAPLSISANTTLVAKKRYYVTSASALTLTLPASPALNDEIQIVDASGNASTYNITVARNANKINGGLNNLIIDTNGGWYTLLYTGATYGWKVG